MTRALIIGPEQQKLIRRAIEEARSKPVPWSNVKPFAVNSRRTKLKLSDRKPGFERVPQPVGIELPFGYRVAISFEEQPSGLFRHLSVSVDTSKQGQMPSPQAFSMIAEEFGFKKDEPATELWQEEFAPGEYAVNMVQLERPREPPTDTRQ